MSIDVVCVACGEPRSAHADRFGRPCSPDGFVLLDSHALDDVPPADRAAERVRLARQQRGLSKKSGANLAEIPASAPSQPATEQEES